MYLSWDVSNNNTVWRILFPAFFSGEWKRNFVLSAYTATELAIIVLKPANESRCFSVNLRCQHNYNITTCYYIAYAWPNFEVNYCL